METSNNAEFIYQYTAKAYEEVKDSINAVTDKLTKTLAFGSVLLKFSYDMESDGYLFSVKFLLLISLTASVSLCATGLIAKSIKEVGIEPEYLIEEQYDLKPETMKNMVSRAWIEGILKLKELRDYRVQMLKYAIGCLIFSGLMFGLAAILPNIH